MNAFSKNTNDREFSGKREVTAFDFNTEHRSHANGSPELGIREASLDLDIPKK